MIVWHILTGEYPPQLGGVSDYTRLVAFELSRIGDEVHIWAPECSDITPIENGVTVHRLPGVFGPSAILQLNQILTHERRSFRLLIQYVPHMYGTKGMNLYFCYWVATQQFTKPWIMFHEVAFPITWSWQPHYMILGITQQVMASIVTRSAERIFLSIPAWKCRLRHLVPHLPPLDWLPIPSTIPAIFSELQTQITSASIVLGHFGTYGGVISQQLTLILAKLLINETRSALLIGQGSEAFIVAFLNRYPNLSGRLIATGRIDDISVARALQACDLLLQPYPDGVSSRRTSVMAGLALGIPILSTNGELSEPIWKQEQLVALSPAGDLNSFVNAAETLISDIDERRSLGERARKGYNQWFSLDRTISILRSPLPPPKVRRPPRIVFLVNGTSSSAMGLRANAFAMRIGHRYDIRILYRQAGKLASLFRMIHELIRLQPALVYIFDMAWSGVGAGLLWKSYSRTPVMIDTGDAISALARSIGRSHFGVALTVGLERVSLSFADRIVVRGTYHREWLATRRIHSELIPDGVEMELFCSAKPKPWQGKITVGLIGSSIWSSKLQSCYGLDLVELIRLLKHKPVFGIMIGGGSGIDVLRNRCIEYGIQDRICFLGHVKYHELPAHLANMDICLSTQTNDLPGSVRTTGKLPLYLAAGRYILASRVGEAARILPNEMLVDYRGTIDVDYPARLAERVQHILENPVQLQLGETNVAIARSHFDYDLLANRFVDAIDSVLVASR